MPEFRAVESLSWRTMCAEAKLPTVVCAWLAKLWEEVWKCCWIWQPRITIQSYCNAKNSLTSVWRQLTVQGVYSLSSICVYVRLSFFLTLFPWWLNRILVTLELPGLLKQMICWEWPHSNILTLPSWAPVRSDEEKIKNYMKYDISLAFCLVHLDALSGPNMKFWHSFVPKIVYSIINEEIGLFHKHFQQLFLWPAGIFWFFILLFKHLTTKSPLCSWTEKYRTRL